MQEQNEASEKIKRLTTGAQYLDKVLSYGKSYGNTCEIYYLMRVQLLLPSKAMLEKPSNPPTTNVAQNTLYV